MAVIFSADGIITGSNGLHTLTNERKTKIAIFSYPSTSIIFFFQLFNRYEDGVSYFNVLSALVAEA